MKKYIKILFIILLFINLTLYITHVSAIDIDMNLTSNSTDSDNISTQAENQLESQNIVNEDTTYSDQNMTVEVPRITSVTTEENEEFLNAENVLSIIIIVIGILILFLGGAILVRFK